MRIVWCAFAIVGLAVLGAACTSTTKPGMSMVTGIVRYPDTQLAYMTLVWIDGGDSTFTDRQGRYRLPMAAPNGSVTVLARDGFEPGMAYAVTHWGYVDFVPSGPLTTQDIVLDHEDPI